VFEKITRKLTAGLCRSLLDSHSVRRYHGRYIEFREDENRSQYGSRRNLEGKTWQTRRENPECLRTIRNISTL